MTVTSITSTSPGPNILPAGTKTGFAALGQGDFLKLMTTQMQQQDPFSPVDQKEMLAQMAQFSSLAATSEMGDTLKAISGKLDTVLSAQASAVAATTTSTLQGN